MLGRRADFATECCDRLSFLPVFKDCFSLKGLHCISFHFTSCHVMSCASFTGVPAPQCARRVPVIHVAPRPPLPVAPGPTRAVGRPVTPLSPMLSPHLSPGRVGSSSPRHVPRTAVPMVPRVLSPARVRVDRSPMKAKVLEAG